MPFTLVESAFSCRLSTCEITGNSNYDLARYMECVREEGIQLIEREFQRHRNIKVNLVMTCKFKNFEKTIGHHFQLHNVIINRGDNLYEFWMDQVDLLLARLDEFEAKGSGWSLITIDALRVQINKYTPLKGSTSHA